jgi:serine phosphatase RsbU (regulator of sigma subunit)
MVSDVIYLTLPFLTSLPAVIAFVKWRNASFRDKWRALEFLIFFSFFFFNLFFTQKHLGDSASYGYEFRIIGLLFLLFLIQMDLSYAIEKKSQTKLLILIFENMLLQVLVYKVFQDVYFYNIFDLFAILFSIYVVFRIGKEYYAAAYISKISRYLLIISIIPCFLFDVFIFRFIFCSFVFYICLEKRQLELVDSRQATKNLMTERTRFESMMGDISNSIKDFSDKQYAAKSYLDSLRRFLSVKGAAIYEWNGGKKYFSCVAVSGLYFPLGIGSEKLFTRTDLLLEMAFRQHIKDYRSIIWKCGHDNKAGILLNHFSDDMDVIFGNLSQEIHSIILLPLFQESELLGVLVLENKLGNDYLAETDLNMAKSFASFAAIILNTSRIATQKNENLRMSMELNSGNVLQNSLFSDKVPQMAGIDVSFLMMPAKEIGGDYYDFLEKDDKLGLVIGDVSGKGVSAGILVAILQTYLQSQYKKEDDLKKLIISLNKYLSNKINTGMFVTLLFFEWDSKQNKLHYVSCGHEHILHFHAKTKSIERIRSGGLALMMDADIEPYIEACDLTVEKGDSVILYTDGVTEAFSEAKEIFGLDRLVEFFEKTLINKSSVEKLLPQTLETWRGDTIQTDDITCLLMQF